LEEDGKLCRGEEVCFSSAIEILTGGGVEKPKVGKSSRLSRLNHFTISGEEIISKLSYFKLVSKEEHSIGNF
jgi:hypothetical protein